MIKWKNPKEQLPENGQVVAVLLRHWKEDGPSSCEIYFGEYESELGSVFNNDQIGLGSQRWHLLADPSGDWNWELAEAWAEVEGFNL